MRYMALGLIIALIIAISGISVWAIETKVPATTQKSGAETAVKVGKKKVKAKSKRTLGDNFKKAHESFAKKNTKAAAADIRKNAKFMKSMSEHTTDAGKETLMISVQELETLASEVKNGTVTSVKTLEDAFANASKALAQYYSLKAAESIAKKNDKKAGKELKAAADYFEASLTWSGTKVDETATAVIKSARETAKKMAKGEKLTDEASRSIKDISAEIEKDAAKVVVPEKDKEAPQN